MGPGFGSGEAGGRREGEERGAIRSAFRRVRDARPEDIGRLAFSYPISAPDGFGTHGPGRSWGSSGVHPLTRKELSFESRTPMMPMPMPMRQPLFLSLAPVEDDYSHSDRQN